MGFPPTAWRASLGDAPRIIIDVTAVNRARLEAVVANRNSHQKHVWRAAIVLDGPRALARQDPPVA